MAIRSSITVCLVPEARGGPFVFWDDLPGACRKARDLGFDAVEVFPSSADNLEPERVRALLSDHGLALSAMGTGAGWVRHRLTLTLPDPAARVRAFEFVRSIIDLAGALGAPAVIGSMQGRSGEGVDREAALGFLTDALEALGEHARQYSVPLLYEPLNRYETNLANTLDAAVALLNGLSTRNVAVLADLFHMNIEEQDLAASVRACGRHIRHVHFVDSNRRAAGFGHIDYPPVIGALREVGYQGFASAEVLPLPDPDSAARQTITAFRAFFGDAG
jgi:sugar phosphate isomerase/epimerase